MHFFHFSRNKGERIGSSSAASGHFGSLLAGFTEVVIANLIFLRLNFPRHKLFQPHQLRRIQVKFKHTELHCRAKSFQRLMQPRAAAIIGNVVGEKNEHSILKVVGV